ncbi:hypothetical protein [Weissella confusa]|uniref:hypothetical protein n=1 Tax=Weissella confusa TaxID=1583 RepID=UPI00189BCC61|nr:hypothetical protein [Weissella confusa]
MKIFISSRREKEGWIDWQLVRSKISNFIKMQNMQSFMFEAFPHDDAPEEVFLEAVENADALIVLINQNVRNGTIREMNHALENGKIIWIFKLDADNPIDEKINYLEVLEPYKIKKSWANITVREEDYTEVILNSIISTILNYYQFNKNADGGSDISNVNDNLDLTLLNTNGNPFDPFFEEVEEEAFKKIQRYVAGHEVWDVASHRELLRNLIGEDHWLFPVSEKRWVANALVNKGNFEGAKILAEQILEENPQMPKWLRFDLLIQLRNIENDIHGGVQNENQFQQQLSDMKYTQNIPVFDKYVSNAESERLTELREMKYLLKETRRYSNVLYSILKNYFNAFAYAVIIASPHFMAGIVKQISITYVEIGVAYQNGEMVKRGLELLFVHGEWNELERLIKQDSTIIEEVIENNIDEMYVMANESTASNDKFYSFARKFYHLLNDDNKLNVRNRALNKLMQTSDKVIISTQLRGFISEVFNDYRTLDRIQIADVFFQNFYFSMDDALLRVFLAYSFSSDVLNDTEFENVQRNFIDKLESWELSYLFRNKKFIERSKKVGVFDGLVGNLTEEDKVFAKFYYERTFDSYIEAVKLIFNQTNIKIKHLPSLKQKMKWMRSFLPEKLEKWQAKVLAEEVETFLNFYSSKYKTNNRDYYGDDVSVLEMIFSVWGVLEERKPSSFVPMQHRADNALEFFSSEVLNKQVLDILLNLSGLSQNQTSILQSIIFTGNMSYVDEREVAVGVNLLLQFEEKSGDFVYDQDRLLLLSRLSKTDDIITQTYMYDSLSRLSNDASYHTFAILTLKQMQADAGVRMKKFINNYHQSSQKK